MKTRLIKLASALLCGAGLFSCTDDIDPIAKESKVYDYVITAYSDDSSTRAELSSDNTILWQNDDEISVLSSTTVNDKFVLTGGQQTTSGTFGGTLSNPDMVHVGIYPYNEGHLFGESGSIVWGKNVQTAYEGDFDPKACLMAGKLDDEGNIKFKNICSYIKFKTDFACTSIEITSTGNPLVSSRVLITLDKDGVPSVIQPDGLNAQYQTVTLAGPSGKAGNATLIPAGTYYVAVLPLTYSSLTFTFCTEFGKTISKTTKDGVDIVINRNTIVNVGDFLLDDLLPGGTTGFYGSGTKSDPYLISSLAKLQLLESQFADHENYPSYTKDTYFLQTNDINCEGKEISIGSLRYSNDISYGIVRQYYPFTGIYDGGGHTISNYKLKECKDEGGYIAGLFNNIYQGTVKNLTVAPATVNSNNEIILSDKYDKLYVGALIGAAGHHPAHNSTGVDAAVTVSNCHLIGGPYNINASRSKFFGGLVGYSCGDYLRLENCTNEAQLSTDDGNAGSDGFENVLGGLIGAVTLSHNGGEGSSTAHRPLLEIAKCRNNGIIMASSRYLPCFAGGLVGLWCDFNQSAWDNLEAHVSNSVNAGRVWTSSLRSNVKYMDVSETCGPSCAGGFFGFFGADESTSYFHNCLNKGNVEAYASNSDYARAGGFLGFSKENNNVCQGNQSGSNNHVYAALCVNTGTIDGKNKAAFCATANGMKCVGCLWLDAHSYTDGQNAAMPYRLGVGCTADTSVDDYYYSTITPDMIVGLLGTMMNHNSNSSYTNYANTLRWGSLSEWKQWAVAWTGTAIWNGTKDLDLDVNAPIAN